jgi:hypothetical protein
MNTLQSFSFKHYLNIFQICLLAALVLSVVLLSCVPPISKDALVHHLAIPKLYLKHSGIYEIPSFRFSYYPMNLDLLYMIPLYFGNDIIPKFIHFTFALLTAWLIFNYLRGRLDMTYALFGAFLFLSLPIIIKLSITVYVDLGLIFFSTASIIYLLKWVEYHFNLKYLLISAIWSGLALGTKYNGLIVYFLLTLFAPFIYSKQMPHTELKFFKALGYGGIFLLVALVLFSPWMIRNYIWTNNPVYPLYKAFFSQEQSDFKDRHIEASSNTSVGSSKKPKRPLEHFILRKVVFKESWWETALIPVRIFIQGQDDNPKYFDGKLNPLLLIFPLFSFFGIKRNPPLLRIEKNVFLAFAILYLFYAFFQRDMRIRYIGPIIPPLVILSMFGLHGIFAIINDRYSATIRTIFTASVFVFVAFLISANAAYIFKQFKYVEPMGYIKGELDRDEYIEKYRPEYAAIKYANENIPYGAKILCLFVGNRSYYSDREMVFHYRLPPEGLTRADTSEKIMLSLKNKGITHLLVRYDLFNLWIQNNFDDMEKKRVRLFFKKYTNLLFSKNGYGLYRLRNF